MLFRIVPFIKRRLLSYSAEERAIGEGILYSIPLLASIIEACGDDTRNFANVVRRVSAYMRSIMYSLLIPYSSDQRCLEQCSSNGHFHAQENVS